MKKLWRYAHVEGLNLERFLHQAGERDITFRRMKRKGRSLAFAVREEQLPMLQQLCLDGGWRFAMGGRTGVGKVLFRLCSRWWLVAGMIAALSMVVVSWQLIWGIDLLDAGIYQPDAALYLRQLGVHAGGLKQQVDLAALREQLEWRYPDVAWIDCGWRGGWLQVRFSQGTPMGNALTHHGEGDVVARRSGVIDSVVVLAGTPMVQPGDIVSTGDVLISGAEMGAEGTTHAVAARGLILARVWDGAIVRMDRTETETVYTGRMQQVQKVRCPWFSLTPESEKPFDLQDTTVQRMPLGGFFFPFIWENVTKKEAVVSQKPRDLNELKAEAGLAALRKLRQKVGFGDDFVDKWVDYCMIEDEVLEAVGIGERLIDIGVTRRAGEK